MLLPEALRTYLISKAAVTAIVGAGDAARIYPDVLPQGATLPAIAYEVISQDSEEHLEGISGLAHSRVRVECYAATRMAADALAELVRLAPLQGYRGLMGTLFANGVSLEGGPRFGREQPTAGSDVWRYMTRQDYKISHTQATT